jgi:hypothetical protein|tara:strand:- start:195 stop:359 length:165 start_codon:yes stop_codon:yes gene_type:complete
MIRYRIISKQILEEGLSYDDAMVSIEILKEAGQLVEMEKYTVQTKLMGRDPDLH